MTDSLDSRSEADIPRWRGVERDAGFSLEADFVNKTGRPNWVALNF